MSTGRGRKSPAGSPGTVLKPPALPGRWNRPWWQRAARGPAASQGSAPKGVRGPYYGVPTLAALGAGMGAVTGGAPTLPGQGCPVVHLLAAACPAWGRCISSIALVYLSYPELMACCACPAPREPGEPRLSFTEGSGSSSWWLSKPVAGAVGDTADRVIGIWGGPTAGPRAPEHSVPQPCLLDPAISAGVSSGAPLRHPCRSPSSPRRFLAGAEQLGCAVGVLAGKAQRSHPLHKAALFRTNPPRIGLHFCQVIHQHVNGKGWSPLNQ